MNSLEDVCWRPQLFTPNGPRIKPEADAEVRNFAMLRAKALFGQHCVGWDAWDQYAQG